MYVNNRIRFTMIYGRSQIIKQIKYQTYNMDTQIGRYLK